MAVDKLAGLDERHRRQRVGGDASEKVDDIFGVLGTRRRVRHDRGGVLHRVAEAAKRVRPAGDRIIEAAAVIAPGHVLGAEGVADGWNVRWRNEEEVAEIRRGRNVGWICRPPSGWKPGKILFTA